MNKMKNLWTSILFLLFVTDAFCARQMEYLDRGLVAVKVTDGVFLSWRMLGTDAKDISFNIY